MQLDFSKLIDPSYWLDPNPPFVLVAYWPLLIFYVAVTLAAIGLPFLPWQPWQRRLKERLSIPFWIFGPGGLAFLFFRYQSIPYLSIRLVHLLFLLVLLVWIGYSIQVARREIREAKLEHQRSQRFQRYLPKTKRKL